jgi:hypothetical protein
VRSISPEPKSNPLARLTQRCSKSSAIDRDSRRALHQDHASLERKIPRVRHSRRESSENPVDRPGLGAQGAQQCQIDVAGESRLAPALQRDAADEAEFAAGL